MNNLTDKKTPAREIITTAINRFTFSTLTRRENEVIRLILKGETTETISSLLGIAFETTKVHRRKAYNKLGINNQSELFLLFIESMIVT